MMKTRELIKAEEVTLTEDFEAEFKKAVDGIESVKDSLCKAVVREIGKDTVILDVGLKSEVALSTQEFGEDLEGLTVGGVVEVYVESVGGRDGGTVASYARARCERTLNEMEDSVQKDVVFDGVIYSRVRGGFVVNLKGIAAFLPFTQVDRSHGNPSALIGKTVPCRIVSIDRARGNIVVAYRKEGQAAVSGELAEGAVVEGVVKNITDYGAFVDVGGVDGLLHVTDISWGHVQAPSDVYNVGDKIQVKILKITKETGRISLGVKQLKQDPWEDVEKRIFIGDIRHVKVIHVQEYGVFVEIEENVEGFIHVKELSWYLGKPVSAADLVGVGDSFDARVLDLDRGKRRFSLSKRQVEENPWRVFLENHPVGSVVDVTLVEVKGNTVVVKGPGDTYGFVHAAEIKWGVSEEEALESIKVGEVMQARVMNVDLYGDGVTYSIKMSTSSPAQDVAKKYRKGDVVTCTVVEVRDAGILVQTKEGVEGFVRREDLAKDRGINNIKRYAEGERVDASFVGYNKRSDMLMLSIRQREILEEKEVMEQYGSVSSGASLREILGVDLSEIKDEEDKK